jgi:hypothetical protein
MRFRDVALIVGWIFVFVMPAVGVGALAAWEKIRDLRAYQDELDHAQFLLFMFAKEAGTSSEKVMTSVDIPDGLNELERTRAATGAMQLLRYGVPLQNYGPVMALAKFNKQHSGVPFWTGLQQINLAIEESKPELLDLPGFNSMSRIEELRGRFPGLSERQLMLQLVRSYLDEQSGANAGGRDDRIPATAESTGSP